MESFLEKGAMAISKDIVALRGLKVVLRNGNQQLRRVRNL